jgi:hypothetical protein
MKVKMSQLVNWGEPHGVMTPRQAIDAGIAEITVSERLHSRNGGRRAVFAQLKGTDMVVEVSGYVAPAT